MVDADGTLTIKVGHLGALSVATCPICSAQSKGLIDGVAMNRLCDHMNRCHPLRIGEDWGKQIGHS